jgi:hypothetical protein
MVRTDRALPAGVAVPALVVAIGERAGVRFLEFFASAIRNPHTRRAYARAAGIFSRGAPAPAWRPLLTCSRCMSHVDRAADADPRCADLQAAARGDPASL